VLARVVAAGAPLGLAGVFGQVVDPAPVAPAEQLDLKLHAGLADAADHALLADEEDVAALERAAAEQRLALQQLVLLFLVGKGAFLAAGASLLLLGLLWAFSFQLCPGRDPS
jgi:hypothetical protein